VQLIRWMKFNYDAGIRHAAYLLGPLGTAIGDYLGSVVQLGITRLLAPGEVKVMEAESIYVHLSTQPIDCVRKLESSLLNQTVTIFGTK